MYELLTIRLDALVILRAKVKQGAKMLAIYRHGSCACMRMRSGVSTEFEALMQFVLARLDLIPPPNFFIVVIQQPGN